MGASGARAGRAVPPHSQVDPATRLLFVCLGNICRSPTAEGVMRSLVERDGLEASIELESAGTGGWHVGSPPDERATAAARAHGVLLEGRARQVTPEDFDRFDLLLAMDRENMRELRRLAPGEVERAKVRMLREFDPVNLARGLEGSAAGDRHRQDEQDLDVPDPYYGASGGFEEVFELVHAACEGLLEQVRAARTS